jgi:hypothetical protein
MLKKGLKDLNSEKIVVFTLTNEFNVEKVLATQSELLQKIITKDMRKSQF